MEIDLGNEVVFDVKIFGNEYKVAEPSVEKIRKYRDELKKENVDEIDAFMTLLVDLGMPKDVTDRLSMNQMKTLADGLMGGLSKKK